MPKHDIEPTEELYTTWYNPTPNDQTFVLDIDGRKRKIVIPPGAKKQVPSIYDYAVQRIIDGKIAGGLSPQSINVTGPYVQLLPVWDHAGLGNDARRAEYERVRAELNGETVKPPAKTETKPEPAKK